MRLLLLLATEQQLLFPVVCLLRVAQVCVYGHESINRCVTRKLEASSWPKKTSCQKFKPDHQVFWGSPGWHSQ